LICACCCCKCFGDPLALFPKTTASFIFTPKLFLLSSYAFLLSNKSANCSVGGGVSFPHGIGLWSLNGNLMYRKYPIFTKYRKWYAVRPKKCKNATTRNTFKNRRARNFRRSLLCCRSFARGECGCCGFDGVLIIVIIFAFVFVADSFPPGPFVFPLIPASPPLTLFVACVKPTLVFFEERCRSLGLVLLPATADDADNDEFDADKEDKDDGGNPNRAILADKSSSSVSLSRFPKSKDIPSPGKSIIPLSSSAELRHRVCRSFCFYPSLSRKASFSPFLSRLRERNVKRERQEATEMMRHTTTHARRDVRVLLCL
jgi:hypothetical protein